MSFIEKAERLAVGFAHRVQDTIGRVIYDYTGIMNNDMLNAVVFYLLLGFGAYILWLMFKPSESVYHYRARR